MSSRQYLKAIILSDIARSLGSMSTCLRGSVGCVITDVDGFILSTGYNGLPAQLPHCTHAGTSGSCKAVHAEQNALMQCRSIKEARDVYVSMSPCQHCIKMLANTPIQTIWFSTLYRDTSPLDWWLSIDREAFNVDLSDATVKQYKG